MITKNYILIEELGKGSYGKVYKAKRKSDDKIIALKIIDVTPDNEKLISMTEDEIKQLKTLSTPECNPFVICYYGSYYDKDNDKFLIEMELVEGETMYTYVMNLYATKTMKMIYYYLLLIAKDILKGLKYTHDKGIIHNDIKTQNIMIDKNNVPRIIDYGLSCNTETSALWGKYCNTKGGTPAYIAPEYLFDDIRLPESDLWSLGIALYDSATNGNYPFHVKENEKIPIVFGKIMDDEPIKLNTSNAQLNYLVNNLLIKEPKNRITVDAALAFLDNIVKPDDKGQMIIPKSPISPKLDVKQKNVIRLDEEFNGSSKNLITPVGKFGFLTPEQRVESVQRSEPGFITPVQQKQSRPFKDTFGEVKASTQRLIETFLLL